MMVEFLSMFTFHPPRADQPPAQPQAPPPPPKVSLRLAGVWRSMTLAESAVHRCLSSWYIWEHVKAKGRISHVDDPLYMYIQRMLSASITAHGHSREWCTSTDLVFFYYLLYRRSCAFAHGLAQYFVSAHHQ
ncbi:hypothetical protein Hanom_Chr10g00942801 [Helianthus anomalus]